MTKVALITGGSGGIGRATALTMGQEYDVVVHYRRDRASAESVADVIESGPRACDIFQCDVTDPEAVETMVARARDEYGRIDVLVTTAGVLFGDGIEDATAERIQRTIRTNLEGALFCVRAVLPDMLRNGAGWIVNVASTAGIYGSSTDVAYGASKGGLIGLTRSLAKQYTDAGIFTNAVAPGPVDTPMYTDDRRAATRRRSPIGRLVEPAEVAEAIHFLSKTSAISGDVLTLDGAIHLK